MMVHKYVLAFLVLAMFMITGCVESPLLVAPYDGGWVSLDGKTCIESYAGLDVGLARIYPSKSQCVAQLDVIQGKKPIGALCSTNSDCDSGYCKPDANLGFCDYGLVQLKCYSDVSCDPISSTQKYGTTCEKLGWKSEKDPTCYLPSQYCGDGKINGVEECDGARFKDTDDCVLWGQMIKIGFTGGKLKCTSSCVIEDRQCELKVVKSCTEIDGAYCGSINWNPLSYYAADKSIFPCADGKTCYIKKDTEDTEIFTDQDNDGVYDSDDDCIKMPEDKDGFEDVDGCPDFDNDQDKIADVDDKCPNSPENYNGYEDTDGCPDESSISGGLGITTQTLIILAAVGVAVIFVLIILVLFAMTNRRK